MAGRRLLRRRANLEAGRQACHYQAGVVINKLGIPGRALWRAKPEFR
jgi:hypothetical protein